MHKKHHKHQVEDTLTVVGQGSLEFKLDFKVHSVKAHLVGSHNRPKPTCDPDCEDFVTIEKSCECEHTVVVSWRAFGKREILWEAKSKS